MAPMGFYLSGEIDDTLRQELIHVPDNVRIHKPGRADHRENIAKLKSCSFGVSPTLIENFSMAFLEAGCCGLPMVTFDIGGNREIIADTKSGFLIPFHDLDGLLQRANSLFDPALRVYMQNCAREHVRRCFSMEMVTKKYLALFDRCISNKEKDQRPI
jgi:glycosyltransferase involved in cell wall biosynthesis